MRPETTLRRFLRLITARLWLLIGRALAVLRRSRGATAALHRAVALDPGLFAARVNLARLALLDGDRAAAVRELCTARAIDPERFSRTYDRLRARLLRPLLEAPAPAPRKSPWSAPATEAPSATDNVFPARSWLWIAEQAASRARSTDNTLEVSGPTRLDEDDWDDEIEIDPDFGGMNPAEYLIRAIFADHAEPAGDFVSEAERRRFENLPPIDRSELERVNWDELFERFAEYEG